MRIEDGAERASPGDTRRAMETARPMIERHKHELSVSLLEAPIWLHADPMRLEQVLVNLLGNAAKYSYPWRSL